MPLQVGDVVRYTGEEYRYQVERVWGQEQTTVVTQLCNEGCEHSFACTNVRCANGYHNVYSAIDLEQVAFDPKELSGWRDERGDFKPFKKMPVKGLEAALSHINQHTLTGNSQRHKIISLEKELASRKKA
jgi:hypothetical protein